MIKQVIAPGILATFQYDANDRRVSKVVNGQVTTYLYDEDQAIGEVRSSETTMNLTGLGLDEAIASYTQIGAGAMIGKTAITDILGTVIAQVKADQTIENRYTYSPYGETNLGDSGSNSIQYTARENDGTGLYFYRARYYDPQLKRFISSDPIGLLGGMNTYVYVEGNPLSYIDSDGLRRTTTQSGGNSYNRRQAKRNGTYKPTASDLGRNLEEAAGYYDDDGEFVCLRWKCQQTPGMCSSRDSKSANDFMPPATDPNNAPAGCYCDTPGYERKYGPKPPDLDTLRQWQGDYWKFVDGKNLLRFK